MWLCLVLCDVCLFCLLLPVVALVVFSLKWYEYCLCWFRVKVHTHQHISYISAFHTPVTGIGLTRPHQLGEVVVSTSSPKTVTSKS